MFPAADTANSSFFTITQLLSVILNLITNLFRRVKNSGLSQIPGLLFLAKNLQTDFSCLRLEPYYKLQATKRIITALEKLLKSLEACEAR